MFRAAAAVAACAALCGCASIVNGQHQTITVEATHEDQPVVGVSCSLSNDKGKWFVTTPGSTMVQRSFNELALACEKAPLEPGLLTAKSGIKAMAFGNILFGGIIGAGVDHATGAAYDYPVVIKVPMGKVTVIDGGGGVVPSCDARNSCASAPSGANGTGAPAAVKTRASVNQQPSSMQATPAAPAAAASQSKT